MQIGLHFVKSVQTGDQNWIGTLGNFFSRGRLGNAQSIIQYVQNTAVNWRMQNVNWSYRFSSATSADQSSHDFAGMNTATDFALTLPGFPNSFNFGTTSGFSNGTASNLTPLLPQLNNNVNLAMTKQVTPAAAIANGGDACFSFGCNVNVRLTYRLRRF